MQPIRVSSGTRPPASYRNTMSGLPSPLSSFSEDDSFPTYFPSSPGAPALPAKSKLRSSVIVMPRMFTSSPTMRPASPAEPVEELQDIYLSEEEGVSSEAEVDDYEWDSDSDADVSEFSIVEPPRIVEVVYAGKPSMVDLTMPSRSLPTQSTVPVRIRQDSDSSMETTSPSASASSLSLPIPTPTSARPISMFTPRVRPSFLNVDPYASPSGSSDLSTSPTSTTAEPSHSSHSAAAMFKRTISLVRKKSRPSLTPTLPSIIQEESSHLAPASHMPSPPVTPMGASAAYEEMMRKAALSGRRNMSSPAPSVMSGHSGSIGGTPTSQISTPVKNRLLSLARKRASRM